MIEENVITHLMNDEIKIKFLVWLYAPHEFLTTEQILEIIKKFPFPKILVIKKIVANLLNQGYDVKEIHHNLKENKICSIDENELEHIIADSIEMKIKNINLQNYDNIKKLSTKVKFNDIDNTDYHDFYPIPDKLYGRPYISQKVCKHYNCNKNFSTELLLIKHLESHYAYRASCHTAHENVVSYNKLTPEKIINTKMTKCPSWICKESFRTFTPENLCEHFKILGIKPFWKVGDEIIPPKKQNEKQGLTSDEMKIYEENICIICFDSDKECILFPCHHFISCLDCTLLIDKCPKCMNKIEYVIPY